MHQNEWSEWEKRCAELAADTERDDDQDEFVTDEPEEVHGDTITEMNNHGDILSLTQQDIEDAKLTRRHSASSVLFSGLGFGRYGHHQQSQRNSALHVSTATSPGGSSGPSSSASASSRGRTESGSSSAVSSSTTQSSVPSFSRSQSSTLLGTGLKHTKWTLRHVLRLPFPSLCRNDCHVRCRIHPLRLPFLYQQTTMVTQFLQPIALVVE